MAMEMTHASIGRSMNVRQICGGLVEFRMCQPQPGIGLVELIFGIV